ncbi:unnamed protein product [Mytilus edulis]|uniref:MAM domain-containing protein n=1 Tax=Mytilus edulis TaxID=6550 RepID=A0A8S3Q4G0_MYTED|nr:unnamed protein product [Mytilus edulis]
MYRCLSAALRVSSLDCNFEKDTCNWNVQHESEYMWTVISGGTHLNDTRPVVDHTYGFYDGHYIYLNASNIEPGQKSNFTSVTVSLEGDACFTFWFHMYGSENGTLNVYLVSENLKENMWERSGNEPDLWQLAFVDISILGSYQMTLEGVLGSTNRGDIAVDDISLLPGPCKKRAFFLDCHFEAECNWLASSNMKYIWTTKKTGDITRRPDTDHTIGTVDGHYIYLQVKDFGMSGMKSKFTSTIINPDGDICLNFWYHMYRLSPDTLRVYTESGNSTKMHWSQNGNSLNHWNLASFTISESDPYRIIFEGVRGPGYWSVIALDDISLHERPCSGLIKTSPKYHNIDESISLNGCSKHYLQLNDTSLVFEPELDNCSAVYQNVQTSITTSCNDMNNSDICTFDLLGVIMEHKRCFQSNWLSVEYRCEAYVTETVSSVDTSSKGSSEVDNAREDDSSAKSSKLCGICQNTIVTERIESSGYNIINYNEMAGNSVLEMKKNRHENNTTSRPSQDTKTSIQQDDTVCNKYESLSTNRNSVEHTYESDPIHTNQYESLTKEWELDKHSYESTDTAQKQDVKTLTKQQDDICNKYESLSTNRNSVEHTYE